MPGKPRRVGARCAHLCTVSPGNSPGTLSAGATTFSGGGAFTFEVNNATGVAGTNWDLLSISGALNIAATSGNKFTIGINTLNGSNVAGAPVNFDFTTGASYIFGFVTTTGGISGFDASKFTLSTSGVDSSITGAWSIAQSGNNLNLVYSGSAIPEPSTYAALFGAAGLGFAIWRRRRQPARPDGVSP